MDDRSPTEPDDFPEVLLQLIKPELQPGERLPWAASAQDRPPSGTTNPIRPIAFTLCCLVTSAGAFAAIFGAYRQRFLSVEPLLIGIGVVAIVVGIVSGMIAVDAVSKKWWVHGRFAANTYALTDRRAIIWIPQPNSKAVEVHTSARGSIKSLHRLEYPDGSGSVRFNYPTEDDCGPATGFENVADVRFVEDLTRRMLVDPGLYSSV